MVPTPQGETEKETIMVGGVAARRTDGCLAGRLALEPGIPDGTGAALHAVALALLGDHELASEAVQLACLKAWQGASTFSPDRQYRRERRSANAIPLDEVPDALVATEPVTMERLWVSAQVRNALGKLRREDREIIQLAYFEGCTQHEVSLVLNIPIGTVKSPTSRAQRQLPACCGMSWPTRPDAAGGWSP